MEYQITKTEETMLKALISSPEVEGFLETTYDFARMMTFYKCAILEIETKFNVLSEETALKFDRQPISSIQSRLKSLSGIMKKLRKKGLAMSPENIEANIHDIAGVRVICSFQDDVYALAQALERQDDIEILKVKDYIKNPKENGYRSLHMIVTVPVFFEKETRHVKVEVQLRTIAMDSWASLEHQLRYKKKANFTQEMSDELKACADLSAELDKKMNALKEQVDTDREKNTLLDYLNQELFG